MKNNKIDYQSQKDALKKAEALIMSVNLNNGHPDIERVYNEVVDLLENWHNIVEECKENNK